MRTRATIALLLLLVLGAGALTAAEALKLVLTGTITNTTHEMEAPLHLELEWSEDGPEGIRGFMTVEPPLAAGRWPVTGRRRGAWMELQVEQTEGTRTILRGVLDDRGRLAGTFFFGGGGNMVQFGRFEAKVGTPPDK